jgi:hypothetical protein
MNILILLTIEREFRHPVYSSAQPWSQRHSFDFIRMEKLIGAGGATVLRDPAPVVFRAWGVSGNDQTHWS